jgi:hypothetical protein
MSDAIKVPAGTKTIRGAHVKDGGRVKPFRTVHEVKLIPQLQKKGFTSFRFFDGKGKYLGQTTVTKGEK